MTDPEGEREAVLLAWLREALDDPALAIEKRARLAGGAIQENVALTLRRGSGERETLVLRTDAPSGVAVSRSRAEEHALLGAAFDAGVTVPEPLALCTDPAVIGRPFFLMRRVGGSANPVRLTRDGALGERERESLVRALGAELARVHAVPLDDTRLRFLHGDGERSDAPVDFLARRVARYRALLDRLGARRPVLEWTLAWLAERPPTTCSPVLCHHDFRSGNLMIDDGRLAGVLDWEFAGPGDPHEDLGWFCAPCWRFAARDREGGGIGSREAFYAGYEAASGRAVEPEAVSLWEIVATLRWAVIALQQGERFGAGGEPTLELGLTGRMIAELEDDLLVLVPRAADVDAETGSGAVAEMPPRAARTVDEPPGERLLESARELLLGELLPALPAERRYAARMAAAAMGIAARELDAARAVRPDDEEAARATARLAARLRDGAVGSLFEPALLDALREDVGRRLALANPARSSRAHPSAR